MKIQKKMIYEEAKKLVQGFEDGSFPAKDWTHKAHFVMALWYLYHEPLHKARRLIKEGIKKFNVLNGGKNTDDSGYHETITEFYIQVLVLYRLTFAVEDDLEALLRQLDLQPFLEREYPFHFYTKDLLMSREARKKWVAPDLQPLLSATMVRAA